MMHSPSTRRRSRRPFAALAAGLVLAGGLGCAELGIDPSIADSLLGGMGGQSEGTIAAGLREALQVGSERSVARTARPGGFLENPRVRIPLPPELQKLAAGLRELRLDSTVNELELKMNRAAEQAAGEAGDLLAQAVSNLTLADADAILRGDDDAATRYLRGETEAPLRERFSPIVESAMREVGLYQAYEDMVARNRVLSLLSDPTVELNRYVTDETLDGLFTVLAEEEKRIREDPVARTTDLLRSVFGSR